MYIDGISLLERGVRERTINPHLADQRGFLSRARNALGVCELHNFDIWSLVLCHL